MATPTKTSLKNSIMNFLKTMMNPAIAEQLFGYIDNPPIYTQTSVSVFSALDSVSGISGDEVTVANSQAAALDANDKRYILITQGVVELNGLYKTRKRVP